MPSHPIQVSQWKKQLLEGAGDLFSKRRKGKEKEIMPQDQICSWASYQLRPAKQIRKHQIQN